MLSKIKNLLSKSIKLTPKNYKKLSLLREGKRSLVVKVVSAVIFAIVVWGLASIWNHSDQVKKIEKIPDLTKKNIDVEIDPSLGNDVWIEKATEKVNANEQRIKQVEKQVKDIHTTIDTALTKILQKLDEGVKIKEGEIVVQDVKNPTAPGNTGNNVTTQTQIKKFGPAKNIEVEIKKAYNNINYNRLMPKEVSGSNTPQSSTGNPDRHTSPPGTKRKNAGNTENLIVAKYTPKKRNLLKNKKNKKEKTVLMIPSGSFVRVRLLNGLYAPTGMKAKSQPQPILMRVVNKAFMPNQYTSDIDGCFIIGEGYGELASERAYIRANRLSCITKDGGVITTSLKGYMVDMDGKIGMRGQVVSRQGLFLARTLTSNFITGIATAFKVSLTATSITPLGGAITEGVSGANAVKIGLGSGVADAFKSLADMYKQLAQETFPVVKVPSGRNADIVFLEDVNLTPKVKLKMSKKNIFNN